MASMQMITNDKGAAAPEQEEGRAEATTNPAPRPDGARQGAAGAAVESGGVDDGNQGAPPAAAAADVALTHGAAVELHGLVAKPELNGRAGVVVRYAEKEGQYAVTVEGQEPGSKPQLLNIKRANLRLREERPPPSTTQMKDKGAADPGAKECANCLEKLGQHGTAVLTCTKCDLAPY
jgi:hypothetical protein